MKKTFYMLSLLAILLSGCDYYQERLKTVGRMPELNKLEPPMVKNDYSPVHWPTPEESHQKPIIHVKNTNKNSLWTPGSRAFFRDQRARAVGDILKVNISIKDNVTMDNKTEHIRSNKDTANATNLFGYENKLKNILPNGVNPASLLNLAGNKDVVGEGKITRNEAIQTQVAAIVTQILPNGNLVIKGHQEVRVNYEIREISVEGIVRPEDITSENIINSDLIAEARISYGGRGHISNLQQPRVGNQVIDVISPF